MLQEKARGEDEEEEEGVVPEGVGEHPEGSSGAGADLLVSYVGISFFLKVFFPSFFLMISYTALEKLW